MHSTGGGCAESGPSEVEYDVQCMYSTGNFVYKRIQLYFKYLGVVRCYAKKREVA